MRPLPAHILELRQQARTDRTASAALVVAERAHTASYADAVIPPAFGDRGTVGLPVDVSGPGAADTAPTRDHHPLERGDSVPQNTAPASMRQPGPAEQAKDA